MSETTTIVTRKDHPCSYCEKIIKKGEKAFFYTGRTPTYDEDDNQIGIEYFKEWVHADSKVCGHDFEV